MKKYVSLLLVLVFLLMSFCSCRELPDAYQMLSEFITVYGAKGIIYSPKIEEGNTGYIPDGMPQRIYVFSGNFPDNYAIFLNSSPLEYSECGVFVCDGADSLAVMEEACIERIKLLACGEDHAFIKVSEMTVFYSTLRDRARAEKIWREIIR